MRVECWRLVSCRIVVSVPIVDTIVWLESSPSGVPIPVPVGVRTDLEEIETSLGVDGL